MSEPIHEASRLTHLLLHGSLAFHDCHGVPISGILPNSTLRGDFARQLRGDYCSIAHPGRARLLRGRAHYFLPERIGGDRNYDYCIAWVCDACLSLALLARLGKVDEVQHYFDWLCGLDSATDAPLRVCYRLGGSTGWTSWSFRRCAAMPQQADTLW
jgi:hypothetical protein